MQFIEMTGKRFLELVSHEAFPVESLAEAGVNEDSVVRINRQGDIEVRRESSWDVIGGLLDEFDERLRALTGLDWCDPTSPPPTDDS